MMKQEEIKLLEEKIEKRKKELETFQFRKLSYTSSIHRKHEINGNTSKTK
ncbi:MAG: hypothetical protein QXR39_07570 [Candidatus Methanomethylicia archaeon]